jgi:hypothetical protein
MIKDTLRKIAAIFVLTLWIGSHANAQDGYYVDIRFGPAVPAVINAKEYEDIEIVITGYSPWLNRVSISAPDGNGERLITATFNNPGMVSNFATPPPTYPSVFKLAGLPAGRYALYVRYPNSTRGDRRQLIVDPIGTKVTMNAYCENGNFSCVIDRSGQGGSRVGQYSFDVESDSPFKAWSPTEIAPKNAIGVKRLKFVPRVGESTYFFTSRPADVALLTGAGFVDEGLVFQALPDERGVCPSYSQPVFRVFVQGPSSGSHRYTTDLNAYREWQRNERCRPSLPQSCVAEGVAFCAPLE